MNDEDLFDQFHYDFSWRQVMIKWAQTKPEEDPIYYPTTAMRCALRHVLRLHQNDPMSIDQIVHEIERLVAIRPEIDNVGRDV